MLFFLKKLGFTPYKAEQPLKRHGVTRKKAQKRLQDTENLFRKNLHTVKRCLLILDLKPLRS